MAKSLKTLIDLNLLLDSSKNDTVSVNNDLHKISIER